jgi:hypothetical protein
MDTHLIIVRQPRKKWGKGLVSGQSRRQDNVLSLLACANSINFQDVFAFDYVSICTGSRLLAVINILPKYAKISGLAPGFKINLSCR